MEHSSDVGTSNPHSPTGRERPFAVIPGGAAGLRLLIVNPVYFLWPLALLFVVLVLGPTISAGLERAAPPRVERSAPTQAAPPTSDSAGDETIAADVESEEASMDGEAAEPDADSGEAASEPRRGFGSCRATTPSDDDADQLSRRQRGGRGGGSGGRGGGGAQGGPPNSPVAAILGLVLALATPITFLAIQASVFRLMTGRAVGASVGLRLGADELRLAAVNVLVPLVCVAVAAPIVIVGLGVQWLPGPCGAVNGFATLLFVAGGFAALAVLVRLALVGPAIVAERRITAWRKIGRAHV